MSAKCDKHSLMIRMLLIKEGRKNIAKRTDQVHFTYEDHGGTVLLIVPFENQPGFAINEMDFEERLDDDTIRFATYGGDVLDNCAHIMIATLREGFSGYRPYGPAKMKCRILTPRQVLNLRQRELEEG